MAASVERSDAQSERLETVETVRRAKVVQRPLAFARVIHRPTTRVLVQLRREPFAAPLHLSARPLR